MGAIATLMAPECTGSTTPGNSHAPLPAMMLGQDVPLSMAKQQLQRPQRRGWPENVVATLMKETTVVVSCPERGTLKHDGSGPYNQEVTTILTALQGKGRIKIAFDRAGTSNASEEDTAAFQAADLLRKADPDNPTWKLMIKDTKWFQTYVGGVKDF
eukprot:COSAG05_NODE_8200_length_727_cov_0.815287_2_plen_156_part_01